MTTLLPAAFLFSLVAALTVGLAGRREAAGSDRLSAAALLILLGLPLLVLLPGWSILPASAPRGGGPASSVVAGVLAAGTVAGLLRLAVAAQRLRRWIRASRPVGERLLPDGRRVEIRELPALASPCAAGVRRPVVLVPRGWRSLPRARRDMVLAHEIAHHRRRDPLWRMLAALACAFHWFNPLVWWLARRHAYQSELACDAAVLAGGARPDRYAHLLCDLAQARSIPLAAAMAGSTLRRRVVHLQQPARHLSRTTLAGLGLLLAVAGLACGLSRPTSPVPPAEVHLRLTADPFPGS